MYHPYPSSGQQAEPLRPPVPVPVRTAVRLIYAGAAVSTVNLISALLFTVIWPKAYHLRWNGHSLTAAQVSHWLPLLITLAIVLSLVMIALWLWMARANGAGRKWARILSTALFGLATVQLIGVVRQPVSHVQFAASVLGVIVTVLAWLVGAAVVWLLWRPASSAFFKPSGFPQAGRSAQPPSPIDPGSRLPHQV